jgi:UDP-galactopyranose mutase
MQRILDGIPLKLNCDYLKHRGEFKTTNLVVFTGLIDEYFGFDLGKLKYRGQQRRHEYLADIEFALPCGQINNPDPTTTPQIRTIEWKHIMSPEEIRDIRGTVLTHETAFTPENPNGCEYPFPDEMNALLYQAYHKRAKMIPGLLVCGRLGEYRYYDMDQAIARAILLARRILQGNNPAFLCG